jgi:hypothetical protein
VASIRSKTAGANGQAESFFGALSYNAQSALANGDDYLESSYTTEDEKAREIARIVAFAPDVLFVVSDRDVVPRIEASWRAAKRRPVYLLNTPLHELLPFLGARRDRRTRVYGVSSVSTTLTNARFVVHYNETFPSPITRTLAPNTSYDAFYLAALALLAEPEGLPAGPALARTITTRFVSAGTHAEVSPTGILPAFNALRSGAQLDLEGTTGRMAFDPATGHASFDLAILCADVDASGAAVGSAESGLVFETATGRLRGDLRCR